MIHIKVFFNKKLFSFFFILILLFIGFFLTVLYDIKINDDYNEELTKVVHRTIDFRYDNNFKIDDIKSNPVIESYDCDFENKECSILFKDYESTVNFKNANIDDLISVSMEPIYNVENYNILKAVCKIGVISIILVISLIIFLVLKSIFRMSTYDIALYKIIGYSNYGILKILFCITYLFIMMCFVVALIINSFYYALNCIVNFKILTFILLFELIGINFIYFFSFLLYKRKIKSIQPIMLIKKVSI